MVGYQYLIGNPKAPVGGAAGPGAPQQMVGYQYLIGNPKAPVGGAGGPARVPAPVPVKVQPPGVPPVPGAAPPPAPPPAPAPTPVLASPLDSTYFQGLQDATFKAGQKIDAIDQQSGYGRIDLQSNLDRLAHQQPIDTLNMQQKYNRSGLLYSGHLGQGLGEMNRGYLDKQSGMQLSFERQQAARDSAAAAIRSGLSITQAALYAAAVDRASKQAQSDPTLSQSSGPLSGGSTASKPPAPTAKPPTGSKPPTASKPPVGSTWKPSSAVVKPGDIRREPSAPTVVRPFDIRREKGK